ncbi:hypothetical protein GN958_ATG23758, partial [Phytophthora infestans]
EHHRQISPGRRPPAARVVERICQLLHRKKDIAGAVWANYWDAEKRTAAPPPGNYVANQHSCPAMVAAFVQQFVRERRAIRQCTVARDVMDKLARNYVIHVDYDSSTAVVFALRPVRQYLQSLGYKRGMKKGKLGYRLREDNARKRDILFVKHDESRE